MADGAADGGEHVLDGEDDGDVLVGCCGHYGDLLGDHLRCKCQQNVSGAILLSRSYQCTTSERDKDLAHDNKANVDIWLAEVNHEPGSKKSYRHAKV